MPALNLDALKDALKHLSGYQTGSTFLTKNTNTGNPYFKALAVGDIPTLTSAKISDFTEAAQDATGAMAANSSKVTLTYVDATPSLTADIVAGSLSNTDLANRTRNVNLTLGNFAAIGGTPALGQQGSDASVLNKTYAWAFDGAADETIQYQGLFYFPLDIRATDTVTVNLRWAPSDGTAGNVKWRMSYAFIDDNDQIDEAVSTADATTATPAVADQVTVSALTTAAKASGDIAMKINISRLGADGSDTYNGLDVWLVGVELQYSADM